jgi:hypothetical protein
MKKGQKDSGDKKKDKKGWGARLMSLIAGSSDEELAPSDDDQDDMPRGKGSSGSSAAARVVQPDPAPLDSRAALKRMLKDPDQKKVEAEVCFEGAHPLTIRLRRCTNSPSTLVWMPSKTKNFFGLLLKRCLLLCQEIGKNLKMKMDKYTITITGLCTRAAPRQSLHNFMYF